MPSRPYRINASLSASPTPLQPPAHYSSHVLIVGASVTGLVTAWSLLDRGHRVTIISKDWPSPSSSSSSSEHITFPASTALWELPPAHRRHSHAQRSSRRSRSSSSHPDQHTLQGWAAESFAAYQALARDPELASASGVRMRKCTSFSTFRVGVDEATYERMQTARRIAPRGFRWGLKTLADEYEVNVDAGGGLRDGYEHYAPVIDTDVAMAFLVQLVTDKGAVLVTETVHGDELVEREEYLRDVYRADVIVNAMEVDNTHRHKPNPNEDDDDDGENTEVVVLRVLNDGSTFPQINHSMVVSQTNPDGSQESTTFIVPRSDNILLLGYAEQSTNDSELDHHHHHHHHLDHHHHHNHHHDDHHNDDHHHHHHHNLLTDLETETPMPMQMPTPTPTPALTPELQALRERCEDLLPILRDARLDPTCPVAQGIRPFGESRIRLERERRRMSVGGRGRGQTQSRVVHCYAQGGAGWSMAFGESRSCVRLVEGMLRGMERVSARL
ncbi:FAD dependent oxidoreductase [Aspergillus egyptiacus]|nr:FAD dependent oxidoreductase [Aspergillus egyptiacus]